MSFVDYFNWNYAVCGDDKGECSKGSCTCSSKKKPIKIAYEKWVEMEIVSVISKIRNTCLVLWQ